MARFDSQIEIARRLIEKNGELVTWRIINDALPSDPSKPWKPGEASKTDIDVFICFLPVNRQTFESLGLIKNTEIPTGSFLGLMSGTSFEPNLKDVVIRDGKELGIQTIDFLSPNGQKIIYFIIFKR